MMVFLISNTGDSTYFGGRADAAFMPTQHNKREGT